MQIKTGRLTVDIAEPGTAYTRPRFDWTGIVTQVTLDEKHNFCMKHSARSPDEEASDGVGLSGEFGLNHPIGYDDTPVGGRFLKIGVGLLTREDSGRFDFRVNYTGQPAAIEVIPTGPCSVRYHVPAVDCHGYAVDYIKDVIVDDVTVTIKQHLTNVGRLPIYTQEYNHNFVTLGGFEVGPGYALKLGFDPRIVAPSGVELSPEVPKVLSVDGEQVRWIKTPEEPFYCRLEGFAGKPPVVWELQHASSGRSIRCEMDFDAVAMALWGTSEMVSPEVFCEIDLAAGQSMAWSRRYRFG